MKYEIFPNAEEIHRREKMGVLDRFKEENRELVESFDSSEIRMDETDFAELYKDFNRDKKYVDTLEAKFESEKNNGDLLGELTEILTFQAVTKHGALGKNIRARKLSRFDDYVGGEDIGIYALKASMPMVSGIDVTSNQNLEGNPYDGLHKKIERVKKHIDYLSELDPQTVNDFKVWVNSGGYNSNPDPNPSRQAEFERLFRNIVVLKYYKTANDEANPNTPMPLFAAPQLVLAYDQEFVNAMAVGNERARREYPKYFSAITSYEAYTYIVSLSDYLKKLGTRNNYIFESYQIAVDTWRSRFSTEEFKLILEEARKVLSDGDAPEVVKKQIRYFRQTVQEVFTYKEKQKIEEETPKPKIDEHRERKPILGLRKKEE